MLCTVVPTHSSPFWCSKLYPSMPSSHYMQSSCTDARLGPPFLPEFTTPILQPSRFVNKLRPAPMPQSHRQTNDANLLHPCMLASPLQCTTPSIKSGSLPLWYVSCQKTATKCATVMAWSTTAQDDTSMNVVSRPHYLRCHNSHTAGSSRPHISVTLPAPIKPAQLLQPPPIMPATPKPQTPAVPAVAPVPAPVCNTQCSPCAAPLIWPCPHCTQGPDPGNITALQPTKGEPQPGMASDCLTICYAHLGKGQEAQCTHCTLVLMCSLN